MVVVVGGAVVLVVPEGAADVVEVGSAVVVVVVAAVAMVAGESAEPAVHAARHRETNMTVSRMDAKGICGLVLGAVDQLVLHVCGGSVDDITTT